MGRGDVAAEESSLPAACWQGNPSPKQRCWVPQGERGSWREADLAPPGQGASGVFSKVGSECRLKPVGEEFVSQGSAKI